MGRSRPVGHDHGMTSFGVHCQSPAPRESERSERAACEVLDRLLELLDGRELSLCEFRVLLGLVERDASVPELARVLGRDASVIQTRGQRLVDRGLLRKRQTRTHDEPLLGLTARGLMELRPLITAAGGLPAAEDAA